MTKVNAGFLESEIGKTTAEECLFQVIPVPLEATVSYEAGTALGPGAILDASSQLETWTGRSEPSRLGIHTRPAVDCSGNIEDILKRIEEAVSDALDTATCPNPNPAKVVSLPSFKLPACCGASVIPVLLGGEHTVTLGALRALKKKYGEFGVVQFDAHADLRDTYMGSKISHATVMRRAMDDLNLPIFQIGVRSLSVEEKEYRSLKRIPRLDARSLRCPRPWPSCAEKAAKPMLPLLPADFPSKVFLTFDIDALDASIMPATGTPEPGGLLWWDALHLVERSLSNRSCIGFDVVELAPIPGMHAPNYTAARLVYEIMGLFA